MEGVDLAYTVQFILAELSGTVYPIKLLTDCQSLIECLARLTTPREKNLALSIGELKQFILQGNT